jgi:hypothetical protein
VISIAQEMKPSSNPRTSADVPLSIIKVHIAVGCVAVGSCHVFFCCWPHLTLVCLIVKAIRNLSAAACIGA